MKDRTEINPSLDRWIWLLKRTVQSNNWSRLHVGFRINDSYLRELADIIDYVADESNNVPPDHKVRASILHNKNPMDIFREIYAVQKFKGQTANQKDVELVQEMIKKTIRTKEYDEELMSLVADSMDRFKKEDKVNSLDQAFQLKKLNLGRPEPEYITPYNIKRLVTMMLDEDLSMNQCTDKLDKEADNHKLKTKDNKGVWKTANELPRPHIWSKNRWQSEMTKYKYTALNDYLLERMETRGNKLDDRDIKRIKRNWGIDMPNELFTYPDFIHLGIGKVTAKGEVIKAKDLH